MTQDKTKKLINELTNVESIKVVNIALELNKLQDKTTGQLIDLVKTMDANMKLLATKVLELEKKNERSFNWKFWNRFIRAIPRGPRKKILSGRHYLRSWKRGALLFQDYKWNGTRGRKISKRIYGSQFINDLGPGPAFPGPDPWWEPWTARTGKG